MSAGEPGVPRALAALLMATSCGGASGSTPAPPGSPAPSPTPTPVPTPASRPNIVVITTDDLDNASLSRMPILQAQLVSKGLTFTNSFVTTPLCCPSRAPMLTGQYAHNHGVLINRPAGSLGQVPNCFEQFRDSGQESSTVNNWVRAAGYRTGFVGKYLNRYPGDMPGAEPRYVPPGWNDWFSQFSDTGNAYYRYSVNDNSNIVQYGNRPQDYLTDVLSARAVQLIHTWSGDPARPFYIYINPAAPHVPYPRTSPRGRALRRRGRSPHAELQRSGHERPALLVPDLLTELQDRLLHRMSAKACFTQTGAPSCSSLLNWCRSRLSQL